MKKSKDELLQRGRRAVFLTAAAVLMLGIPAFSKDIPGEDIKTQTACEKAGGKWDLYGEVNKPRCSLPTKDAGKYCSDDSECTGICTTELLNPTQKDELGRGRHISLRGQCSAWTLKNGCFYFVRKGFASTLECIEPKTQKK